ncbi:MAG: hypothetical protein N3A66_12385, partial [Planctomycetota bacterium]|nr:hypothetical protein [Planctomycetota bacterium]
RYAALYNQAIPQRALGHLTPLQALMNWYQKRPDLFISPVYNQAGPDTRQGVRGAARPLAASSVAMNHTRTFQTEIADAANAERRNSPWSRKMT